MEEKVWRPHEKQEEFLSIPYSIFERFYGGAAGGGKSELLVLIPIIKGFYKHPKFKGLLLRRTYPELERSLIARSREWYPYTGAKWNDKNHRWTWPNGAFVDFGHIEYEKNVRDYDTTEYNYIGLDELTSFTEFQYRYIMSRCRTSVAELPSFVCSASNPGNIGHGWVRKRFVEPAKQGFTCIIDKKSGEKRIFIPAKLTDNPHLMRNDPGYYNRLMLLPEAERKAKLDGDWWTFSGQAFDEWRENKYPDEPSHAIHVIKPFAIPNWWPRILSIDWGYTAMLWAGWGAISPDARCFLYREYTRTRTKIAVWATDIRNISKEEHLNSVVMCPSAWQNRGHEKNIAEQFTSHSGLIPKIADNDRLGGKMMVHEFLRWEPKPLMPPRDANEFDKDFSQYILRTKGMDVYRDYLKSFEPEPVETNLPRLQVFDNCEQFINAIPKCVYNDPTTSKGGDPEDIAEFDGDDPYDGGRYLVKEVDNYVRTAKARGENLAELQHIVDRLEQTQDMTSYYLAMKLREIRGRKDFGSGVSRFHKRRPSMSELYDSNTMGRRPS